MLGALVAWSLGVVQTLLGDYASVRLDTWVYAWMAALLPSAVGGIAEDLTQRLAVRYRLALTAASGILALLLVGLCALAAVTLGLVDVGNLLRHWPQFVDGIRHFLP